MNLPEHPVGTPEDERPDRAVEGWSSDRKEASGQRLHGYFRTLYGSLDEFFQVGFVVNYCPLVLFSEEGTNLTPEDLLKEDREPLFEACDPYLEELLDYFDPDVLVGVGRFAQRRLGPGAGGRCLPAASVPRESHRHPRRGRLLEGTGEGASRRNRSLRAEPRRLIASARSR